jgi:hypothetical protein
MNVDEVGEMDVVAVVAVQALVVGIQIVLQVLT